MIFQGTTILCVYRQPGGTNLMVREPLISDHSLPMMLLGDFNVQYLEWLASFHASAVGRSWHNLLVLPHVAPRFWI